MADDDRQAALNAIDLKGNIVLKEFGDTALLFRPQNNYEPFVVAYGYDKAAGEWSHGSYHTDLGHAFGRTCHRQLLPNAWRFKPRSAMGADRGEVVAGMEKGRAYRDAMSAGSLCA